MGYPEGPKYSQTHAYKREAEGDFTLNRRQQCNQSGRDCGDTAKSQGIPPEARRGEQVNQEDGRIVSNRVLDLTANGKPVS